MLRPASRGHVRIASADAAAPPVIQPNYLSDPADQALAVASVKITRAIVAQPALAPYNPREFRPGPDIVDDDAIRTEAGQIATTIFHPVGTAAMGTHDRAVVDPALRLRGLSGLRIADASIMPNITSGNTNAPVMMIAERAAALIRKQSRH